MIKKYQISIHIDTQHGVAHHVIDHADGISETNINAAMKQLRNLRNVTAITVEGVIISIPAAKMHDVWFTAKQMED